MTQMRFALTVKEAGTSTVQRRLSSFAELEGLQNRPEYIQQRNDHMIKGNTEGTVEVPHDIGA